MTTIASHDLANTIVVALERMAFVLTEEIDAAEAAQLFPPTFHAKIDYSGPSGTGQIFLSASEGFITEMSSSMLGMEPDEVEEDIETLGAEAIRELANVVGGEIIIMLGGKDVEFQLGLPESCDAGAVQREGASGSCHLESDGELLEVHVCSKG